MTALWAGQDRESRDRQVADVDNCSTLLNSDVSTREASGELTVRCVSGERGAIDDIIRSLSHRYPSLPEATVAEVVNGSYARFDGSPIRDYVPLLVERAARAGLSQMGARRPP
jgi:hypothetical protein